MLVALAGCAKAKTVTNVGGSAAPTTTPSPAPAATATSGSGVSGSVVAGPTCPVERPDHPCPPRAVTGATVTADGHSTRTDDHGNFTLNLPPGAYDVSVSSRSVMHCTGQRVQVTSHRYTHVTLNCDTGIR